MTTQNQTVTIRRIHIDDLDEIQKLYAMQTEADTDIFNQIRVSPQQHAWEMRRLRQQWLTEQRYLAYVATVQEDGSEKIVGYIAAVIEIQAHLYKVESLASMGELWVIPEYRHRGIGCALASELVDDIEQRGIEWVSVHLSNDMDDTVAFFERCGFTRSAVEMRYRIQPQTETPDIQA